MKLLFSLGILCLLLIFLLGCSTASDKPAPPIKIVGNTYCIVAKTRTWSVNDTPQTTDGTRESNTTYQCLCARVKPKDCPK